MSEKLIFPIGFDLEEGVKEASKEWKNTYQKQLQKAIDDKPLKVKIDFESKGIDTKEFKQWMALAREAEKLERERIKNAKEWQKVADQQAMAETRRANATNESNARIERQNRKAEASERRKKDAVERTNEAYKRQGGYLSRLFQRMVAYASVAQAFSFVRNIRDVTAEFELQRVALGSIIGDLNEANAMFEQIKAAAVKSPFQIKELVTYTKQLAAYKIESDELFETTQRLADISAGLGVGMERLVLAYGQIRATGYLRASEVRQLTEAGIPIVEELAKKMSQLRGETVSAAEVMGMISERAISFGMVKEVFDDMTSAGGMFYKMQEKQAETLAGQWSNLKDSIAIMYEEIGNTEGVNNAMKGVIGLVKSLAENWRVVGDVAVWSVGAALGYAKVIKPISELVKKQDLLKKSSEAYAKSREALHLFMQTGDKDYQREYQWQLRIARSYRQSANAAKGFGGALKSIGTFIKGNIWGILLTVLATIVTYFISARKEAKRLNEELAKIGTEGALQADQSVRNFERLAKTIRESADGSREQSEALAELKRTYGDLLPTQDKEILALVKVKEGYEDVATAIREKINAQIYEQKMNAIISDYSERLANKQKKPKKWLENMGFSVEETTRIFNAIDKAVQEGLIKVGDLAVNGAHKIEKIIKAATGKFISLTDTVAYVDYSTGEYLGDYEVTTRLARGLFELANVYSDFNNSVNELADSQKRASNITWEYQEGYEKLKDSIAKTNAKFNESTFAGGERIKANTLAKWREYFISLSDIFAKTPKGGIVDFNALEDEIEKLPANLRAHIRVVQEEYEKLIPTDITRLANDKLQEYADNVGISMDDVKEHLKTNEQSTEDWAKGLKGAYESLEKKLAEYKKSQDAFSTQGAPFKDWTEDIEETTKEMEVLKLLMEFFKEFFKGGDTKQRKSQLSILQEELQLHEKIYAKYKEYRQYMSAEDAKAKVEDYFGNTIDALKFKPSFDKSGYQSVLKQYKKEANALLAKAKDETEKASIKKFLLDIGFKIGDKDWEETKDNMEKNLKRLSDDLSRTKTAKEFFDRMLGLTGDKQLSATLTMSVYGIEKPEGELSEFFAKQLAKDMQEQIQEYLPNIDISSAINEATGKIDPVKLKGIVDALDPLKAGETNIDAVKKLIKEMIDGNANYLESLYDSYEKFLDYEHRKTIVAEREAKERKKIAEQNIPEDEKKKLTQASEKRERTEKLKIDIEQFKAGEEYIKIFEEIENLSTMSIGRLMRALDKFMKDNAAVLAENPEQLKTLMGEYQKLYEGFITRNPFRAIVDGLKEYQSATKNVISARKELKKAEDSRDKAMMADAETKLADALDKQQEALNKQVKGYQAASSALSNFGSIITDITEILGIAEDSKAGAFIEDLVKWLGVMATVLSTVAAILVVINTVGAPFLAIATGIAAIAAGISYLANAKVRKANQEIERQQELLDDLSYSYDRLQKSAERAFGTEYIQNYQRQLDNLEAQVEAYEKQLDAERSKGKKADEEKIKEYKNQIRDTKDAIEDMYGSLSEHFLGTDLTSAARDFASAWIDAYKEFGSTTDAMKEKFQDMIQNMIVNSLAAKIMERALEPVFTMIDEMDEADFYDPSFWQDLMAKGNKAMTDGSVGLENVYGWLESIGMQTRNLGGELTGISRDIATASEESILGLAAGINTQNFYISQVPTKLDTIIGLLRGGSAVVDSGVNVQDLITIQNQFLSHLPTIAQNTAETVARCERAAVACESMASKLGSVIKPKGTTSTHSVNVTIGS